MKITEYEVESFANAAYASFNLESLTIDKSKALEELSADISAEFEDLNSAETKQARHEHFNIEGTNEENYIEKILDLGNDKKIIYGIRHMGGNREIPFIQFAPNFTIESKKQALSIYEKVKDELRAFKPMFLSFWSHKQIDEDFIGNSYMVSTAESFKTMQAWPQEEGMVFENIGTTLYYAWYKKGYEEFHLDCPELAKKVTINGIEIMNDSMEQGLLKYINLNGERIGLIAAEKSKLLNHDGLYFNEIYIEKKYKGRGLAKAIQRKFVNEFSKGHEFIWGTIDTLNKPSYKTAYSNGRRPIRFECFIDLAATK